MDSTEFVNDRIEEMLEAKGPMLQAEIIMQLRVDIAACLEKDPDSTFIKVLIITAIQYLLWQNRIELFPTLFEGEYRGIQLKDTRS